MSDISTKCDSFINMILRILCQISYSCDLGNKMMKFNKLLRNHTKKVIQFLHFVLEYH